jgi:L-alanine-DL-glutamate epimerase-like enolase superfamily enzyme
MKVTGVKVTPYACPTGGKPAGRHANGGSIVELLTDSDLTGIAIGADEAVAQMERFVAEVLVGADPRATTAIWRTMSEVHAQRRREDPPATTIAALDIALWDLKAKANAEPLWKTLGGTRPRANAHAGSIALTATDRELTGWYGSLARDHGLRGAKLRVGLDEEPNLARLALMRTALEHGTTMPTLIIDAEQCWTPKQAIRRLREIEHEFDVATRGEFLPHFQHRSADVIQLDIGIVGITGALELADAAYGFELPVTLAESPGNIHAHLSSVMPYFMSMEVVEPLAQWPVFATDVRIEAGWAIAGDAPGNGLAVDRAALGRAIVRAGR